LAAIVRIWRIKKELEAICKRSQRLKHLIKEALRRVSENPAHFPTLDWVPQSIVALPGVCIRKIQIVHQKHNYRLIYVHVRQEGAEDRALFFQILPRRANGYDAINWEDLTLFASEND
jgi:hypothetical protein